jgi:nucleoside-diphosphate-sugar epimerase
MLIFGAGFSGRAIGAAALERGAEVHGTTRSLGRATALREAGIRPLIFTGAALSRDALETLRAATHLVISIPPGEGDDPVIAAARAVIAREMPALRWIGYLSTIGVYGDHDGEWVDETARCRPTSQRSTARLTAENRWQEIAVESRVPVAIMRLAGIYGPGRNTFVNLANGKAKRLIKPGQVFNRIHVDDIAGATMFLAENGLGGIYNVTDNEPAPPQDVVEFAAGLMGVEPPEEVPFGRAELTPMQRSFYGENKRVSNAKLREAGYEPRYPNYKASLAAMWSAGNWAGETLRNDAA